MSFIVDDRCVTCHRWVEDHPYCARLRSFCCEPCPDNDAHRRCEQ